MMDLDYYSGLIVDIAQFRDDALALYKSLEFFEPYTWYTDTGRNATFFCAGSFGNPLSFFVISNGREMIRYIPRGKIVPFDVYGIQIETTWYTANCTYEDAYSVDDLICYSRLCEEYLDGAQMTFGELTFNHSTGKKIDFHAGFDYFGPDHLVKLTDSGIERID